MRAWFLLETRLWKLWLSPTTRENCSWTEPRLNRLLLTFLWHPTGVTMSVEFAHVRALISHVWRHIYVIGYSVISRHMLDIWKKKALTTVKRGYVRQEWKKAAGNKTADLAHLFKTSIKIDIFWCLRYGIVWLFQTTKTENGGTMDGQLFKIREAKSFIKENPFN